MNKFQSDAIETWLERNDNSVKTFNYDNYEECCDIHGACKLDVVVLSEEIKPEKGIRWLCKLRNFTQFKESMFVAMVSAPNAPDLQKMIKTEKLSVLHCNDAKLFFKTILGSELQSQYLSPSILASFGQVPPPGHPVHLLTRSELRIACFALQNMTSTEIGSYLFLSPHTIEANRKHIKEKINVSGGKNAFISSLSPFYLWLLLRDEGFMGGIGEKIPKLI